MPTAAVSSMQSVLDAFNFSFGISDANASLLAEARLGNAHTVLACLQQGCDPNVKSTIPECNHPVTALSVASACGHELVVEMLLQAGARADLTVGNGYTPLYLAAQGGHDGCVARLLAHPNMDYRRLLVERSLPDGATALLVAAHQGHACVVNRLLGEGASTSTTAADGSVLNAADVASAAGHPEVVAIIRACEEYRVFGAMSM